MRLLLRKDGEEERRGRTERKEDKEVEHITHDVCEILVSWLPTRVGIIH